MSQRRPVVQVVANLNPVNDDPEKTAVAAVTAVLDWLRVKQKVKLPEAAYAGEPFEIDAADDQPVSAERVGPFWSLQFDRFDVDVPGRIWRTETSVAHSGRLAVAGVRLAVIDTGVATAFSPSVPRVIGNLIRSPGLNDYGAILTDTPSMVATDAELAGLVSLLEHPDRTRPVLVLSEDETCDAFSDATLAASRLAGIGHVFVINEKQGWHLTEQLGREFSVWKGAVRTYNPGFNPQLDEVMKHPPATRDWLKSRFSSLDHFYSVLVNTFAARTVRSGGLEESLPSFRSTKQIALQKKITGLASSRAEKSEREMLLEKENALLKQQIAEKSDEFNLADAEVKQVEEERDQYRAQLSALGAKVDSLEEKIGAAALAVDYPDTFEEIDDWVLKNFAGRLILLNRAARTARKSPFSSPRLVYQCLEKLARNYVDARRNGRPVDGVFDELGVRLERTGDESRLSQWKELYFVPHRTRNQFLEWHLKRGSDKSEANTMRIYFFFDEDDQQVVVGHLPGHLPNEKS